MFLGKNYPAPFAGWDLVQQHLPANRGFAVRGTKYSNTKI